MQFLGFFFVCLFVCFSLTQPAFLIDTEKKKTETDRWV